jgi:ribokinase
MRHRVNIKPIVVVGSINMDLVVSAERMPLAGETVTGTSFQQHPGGKGANQAVAIARLGHEVRMIGRVGSDPLGEELLQSLRQAGVDISGVKKVAGSSGVAVVVVSDNGQNCIIVTPGANAQLSPDDLEEHREHIRSAAAVLTQVEIPLETVQRLAQICREEAVPLILDPAPARSLPPDLIRLVTWFTPNETEAAFYLRDSGSAANPAEIVQTLQALGAANVILKRGEQGFQLVTSDGKVESGTAHVVRAVDTTAAGDAFNGAFATALVRGRSPIDSATFATAAAAISVTRHGAQPSMPTLDEVTRLLAETKH